MRPLLLILSVVQNPQTRATVRMVLEGAGHRVVELPGRTQACSILSNGLDPDLLICDARVPDSPEGLDDRQFLRFVPAKKICLITRMNEEQLRKEAAALGIEHFLAVPVTREDLESVIEALSPFRGRPGVDPAVSASSAEDLASEATDQENSAGVSENVPAVPYIEDLSGGNFFLAASPQMLAIYRQVKLLADVDLNVLILGESGTGKEIVAQLIHQNSRRCKEKFLKVNCAALPADLLESELFGHRKGAFTGAINDRLGKFDQAHRGMLLLDEIGEIGVQMQAKLLHVLQDGQFARLGAQETTQVDVRVLAATNVQMEDALLNKTFREDLYYRLSVFTINVPPLRERREEIPYLIEQFIRRSPEEMRNGFGSSLPSRLMDVAFLYDWRGNLRELRNFVTQAMVMRDPDAATRELEAKVAASVAAGARDLDQDQDMDAPLASAGIRSVVRDVKERTEVQMIQSALEAFGWNRRRAAQYLNISYRGMLYKIQQHRLSPPSVGKGPQALKSVKSSRCTAA